MDNLETLIKKKDFEEITLLCHKMKSPISLFGLNNLKEKFICTEKISKILNKSYNLLNKNFVCIKFQMDLIYKDLQILIN